VEKLGATKTTEAAADANDAEVTTAQESGLAKWFNGLKGNAAPATTATEQTETDTDVASDEPETVEDEEEVEAESESEVEGEEEQAATGEQKNKLGEWFNGLIAPQAKDKTPASEAATGDEVTGAPASSWGAWVSNLGNKKNAAEVVPQSVSVDDDTADL
jgi:hypothetical protein